MSRTRENGVGLFDTRDLAWRVSRERVLLLAGPRALLMQLAHPLVAQAVADHSDFRRRPVRRLRRTLDAMLGILFGSREQALACAARVNRIHGGVRGSLRDGTASFAAGTPYRALDPALLFWVLATLVDTSLTAYESFVGPLSADERRRFYTEVRRMAPLLALPEEALPADWRAFRAEFDSLLAGPVLEITPTARALADAVLHPPLRGLPRAAGDLASIVTLGLLPATLRSRYGFAWTPGRQRAWRVVRATIRTARPLLPVQVRQVPEARMRARERGYAPPFSTSLAQVSRRVTVRLKTGADAFESGSTQK